MEGEGEGGASPAQAPKRKQPKIGQDGGEEDGVVLAKPTARKGKPNGNKTLRIEKRITMSSVVKVFVVKVFDLPLYGFQCG